MGLSSWNKERLTRLESARLVNSLPASKRARALEELREGQSVEPEALGLQPDHKFADSAASLVENCEKNSIAISLLGESDYPSLLAEIPDAPPVIFYRGKLPSSEHVPVAVVGSRKADLFGCQLAFEIALQLSENHRPLISGLALGIDGAAHRGALKASDTSHPGVAVLGGGVNQLYPRAHQHLANELVEKGGALLSQFEPDEKPFPSHFVNRNRVIAGLSGATLVVQAGRKSGALVTARRAAEYGRDVLALPGDIRNELYSGSLQLLQEGAYPVTSVTDALLYLGIEQRDSAVKVRDSFSLQEQAVISSLKANKGAPLTVESLQRALLMEEGDFQTGLLQLELKGLLVIGPGGEVNLLS